MTGYILLGVVVVLLLWAVSLYNKLVTNKNLVAEGWSGIDVQLKRRSDLVANLVDTVKGYAAHERDVLTQVAELRSAARALPADDIGRRAQAEDALSLALGKLMAVAESYPDLKASGNFLALQQELSQLESELQMARRYYNGTVRNLNILVESFPSNLIAGLFGFARGDFFELTDSAERATPAIAF